MAGRVGGVVLAALIGLPFAGAAADGCGEGSPAEARRRLESASYVLVFRPVPAPLAVGRHFRIEAAICPRGPVPPPDALRVDAVMPEHRHGMNYRASVSPRGDGRFVAEGLLFHMPGRWTLLFDVDSSAGTERLMADVVLE